MSVRWNTVLVLGGIRSGKSAFAESLVADATSVRYVATAVGGEDDPEWMNRIEEHQRRRPQTWTTEETGPDPARLAALIANAKPDDTVLVDDLGGWVAALLAPEIQPNDDVASVDALADAVRACAARLVIVSPEVGLSLVPVTAIGRAFADAIGTANQALAAACDGVALIVAGQPTWLRNPSGTATAESPAPPPTEAKPQPEPPAATVISLSAHTASTVEHSTPTVDVLSAPTMMLPLVSSGIVIQPGMELPLPDTDAGPDARDRLCTLDLPGTGIGALGEAVEFAAATQNTSVPRVWQSVRVLLLAGHHAGGAAVGDDPGEPERRIAQLKSGEGTLARLASAAGADVAVLRLADAGPMEDGPVMDSDAVEAAMRQGWQLADQAAEDGRDVLILASYGTGTDAAATAVLAATTGAEPVAILPRVLIAGGYFDDAAWMARCAAVRDAMHRIRQESRGAKDVLAQIGGPDLAVATGALLGATARRTPVLLDGPVGVAAALIARDLAGQSRHWCLIPEAGTHALVRQGADVLGLAPVLGLGLDLGEGANALATLPLLRTAIGLVAALPVHPALSAAPDDDGLSDDVTDPDQTVEPDQTQPTPTQPTPTQPGSAQPGSAQPGSAQPGSAQPGSAQPGSAQPGSAQPSV